MDYSPILRLGAQTLEFPQPIGIAEWATVAGPAEGMGRYGGQYDIQLKDDLMNQDSWEKAERQMFEAAARCCLSKAGVGINEVDLLLGGDLLNQIVTAGYAARELGIPFLGLYAACATSAAALGLGSVMLHSGCANKVLTGVASHFATAERQYRNPLELGSDRPPTAQRTVTGAGAFLLQQGNLPVRVTHFTIGEVVDWNITDANDMGAAMAPAAAQTVCTHLAETGRHPKEYDRIVTGDLGSHGSNLFLELVNQSGHDLAERHLDCGERIFTQDQEVQSGGSGCACGPLVLAATLLPQLQRGALRRILLVTTGALLSPTTSLQGESIPGIAHAVTLEGGAPTC